MIPKRTGKGLCLALLLSLPAFAAAEVELSAAADATEIALDGTLMLRITVSYASKGDSGELQLPAFNDFEVVNQSRSEQVSFTFVNGAPSFRRTVLTVVALTPKRLGELTIEPAKLDARGRISQTQPIRVRVVPAGQAQRSGRASPDPLGNDRVPPDVDPFADVHPGQRDLLLRATVDNERPFVGEQVTYSLYLLARANVSSIER